MGQPHHHLWSSDRAYAVGEHGVLLTPHPHFLAFRADDDTRHAGCRTRFRRSLDDEPLADLRMMLEQSQPIGNDRFYRDIKDITGQRRAPRKQNEPSAGDPAQGSCRSTANEPSTSCWPYPLLPRGYCCGRSSQSLGAPWSHFLQDSTAPSLDDRPSGVTTQGRLVQGGLWRTCWLCPHSSSATQSFCSSTWNPTILRSAICGA